MSNVPIQAEQEETQTEQSNSQSSTHSAPVTGFEALQQRLHEDPHDTESWKRLAACAEESGETEKIRTVYDSLLQQFPHTVRLCDTQLCGPLMCSPSTTTT